MRLLTALRVRWAELLYGRYPCRNTQERTVKRLRHLKDARAVKFLARVYFDSFPQENVSWEEVKSLLVRPIPREQWEETNRLDIARGDKIRESAFDAIVEIGEPGLPVVRDLLSDAAPAGRALGARIIPHWRSNEWALALVPDLYRAVVGTPYGEYSGRYSAFLTRAPMDELSELIWTAFDSMTVTWGSSAFPPPDVILCDMQDAGVQWSAVRPGAKQIKAAEVLARMFKARAFPTEWSQRRILGFKGSALRLLANLPGERQDARYSDAIGAVEAADPLCWPRARGARSKSS